MNAFFSSKVATPERSDPGQGLQKVTDQGVDCLGALSSPKCAEDDLSLVKADLAAVRKMLELLVGPKLGGTQPFQVAGKLVHFVTAEELSGYIPRSADTLIGWAKRGVIPSYRPPGRKGTKAAWMFDVQEVYRVLSAYRRG